MHAASRRCAPWQTWRTTSTMQAWMWRLTWPPRCTTSACEWCRACTACALPECCKPSGPCVFTAWPVCSEAAWCSRAVSAESLVCIAPDPCVLFMLACRRYGDNVWDPKKAAKLQVGPSHVLKWLGGMTSVQPVQAECNLLLCSGGPSVLPCGSPGPSHLTVLLICTLLSTVHAGERHPAPLPAWHQDPHPLLAAVRPCCSDSRMEGCRPHDHTCQGVCAIPLLGGGSWEGEDAAVLMAEARHDHLAALAVGRRCQCTKQAASVDRWPYSPQFHVQPESTASGNRHTTTRVCAHARRCCPAWGPRAA